jgi:hypothetical protein
MASPLGLTTFSTGSVAENLRNSGTQSSDNQNVGYSYNGYNFKKYSSAPNVANAKRSIFSGGSTGFKTKFDHSNDIYDIRTTSIIKYCNNPQTPGMKLKAEDFAYLRNLGVYSNNRLIIVRRFPAPVGNDLTIPTLTSPMSTLISWIPDTEKNFLDVSFGEVWTDAEASLKKLLNDVGDDLTTGTDNKSTGGGKGVGNMLAGGLSALPLPGFMEGVQLEILKKLGYTDNDSNSVPSGNPNIIKEAKVRSTTPKDDKGSGLKCKVSIKFETEYEQKFIDGVDPTLVYLDVISTALRFGTSESRFIINTKLGGKGTDIINKIKAGQWIEAIEIFVKAAIDAMKEIAKKLIATVKNGAEAVAGAAATGDLGATANAIFDAFLKTAANTIISKYRVRLGGIMSALSGEASTPWHVTIGNPKRPVFSSGDMLVEEVTIDLGNTLSFNDLPSNIKIGFTLTNARSLGAQEIFERFNCGGARIVGPSYGAKANKFEEVEIKINKK